MNKKGIIGFVFAVALLFVACDRSNNSVGYEVLPEYLKSSPLNHHFQVQLRTVKASTSPQNENIYVSSAKSYLGTIPSSEFGAVKSEYLTQFYMPEGFRFKDEAEITKIDSVRLNIYYDGVVGDTISNMAISAYRVAKPLEHNKYTITDIEEYKGEELGRLSYWSGRGSQKLYNNKGELVGYRLSIPFPTELGQEFFDRSKAGDPVFANQRAFDQWFSGVYVAVSAGQGSVIRVSNTELSFYYTKEVTTTDPKTKEQKRSSMAFTQSLIHTSEVPQLSMFANYQLDNLLQDAEHVSVKAPGGTWVEMTIPTTQIEQVLKAAPKGYTRYLNATTYTLQGIESMTTSGTKATLLAEPSTLLMLPVDRVEAFFENEQTDNSIKEVNTTFVGQMTQKGSKAFHFGNISSMILQHIEEHPGEDLKVVLIPVERIATSAERGNRTISISHLVLPSAMTFLVDKNNTTIEATIVERKEGAPFL